MILFLPPRNKVSPTVPMTFLLHILFYYIFYLVSVSPPPPSVFITIELLALVRKRHLCIPEVDLKLIMASTPNITILIYFSSWDIICHTLSEAPARFVFAFPFTAMKAHLNDSKVLTTFPQYTYTVSWFRLWWGGIQFAFRKGEIRRISLDVKLRHVLERLRCVVRSEGFVRKCVVCNKARDHMYIMYVRMGGWALWSSLMYCASPFH
jgi:hypothetical protein